MEEINEIKEPIKGKIHSFESFGTVDGPGIRFIVFFQGCALQCKYCHNRDTWDINADTIEYSAETVVNMAMRSKSYMISSGGGVTLSGGEPFLQQDFLLELLTKFKEKNVHITIDTSGVIPLTTKVKEIINLADLILLDMKHIDDEKCKNLTGVSNMYTLEFARYLNSIGKPMWLRQVIVPGYTDDEDDLLKLKKFIKSLDNITRVDLLPYHDLGKFKWTNLNLEYPLENVPPATPEDIDRVKEILEIE